MDKQNSKYRWVVFGSVLLTYFLIVSQRTAPGLITDQLMTDFHITASMIGLLTSVQFFAYAGLQVPVGILSDRYGPNIFLVIGTFLTGIGTFLYSIAANEYVLLVARLIVGTGDATIWINLVLILSVWFKGNEFVKLLGMAGMTGSLGFLMATVPFSIWISNTGWRPPFSTTGIIICLCGILLYFVLIRNPKKFEQTETKSTIKKSIQHHEKTSDILKRVFTNRQAWATFLCHYGTVGTYVGFIGSWAVPYGMNVFEMSRSGASQFVMIGLLGAMIGAPLTSWLSSKLGMIRKPYVLVHIVVLLCWSSFILFQGKPPFFMLILLYFLIGYGNGASALTFAVVRKTFDVKEVGVVSGFANMGGFISAVLLPSAFGKVLDHFQGAEASIGYFYGFMIPAVFALMGLIGGLLIKENSREVAQEQKRKHLEQPRQA
ncbi:MFS transporter [Metabacillus malikii]|uniref:Lysosomal dipeptide transporter MFSD1 n=1 Tax=Metabacillus malikii TaxID=1504265 RepID=A0ABT9ZDZ8_9BACI|nr:MFS transporter [Metabacillus malikii]MDQ0230077.1 sugar phosphate permease [Metabacillus malikii]